MVVPVIVQLLLAPSFFGGETIGGGGGAAWHPVLPESENVPPASGMKRQSYMVGRNVSSSTPNEVFWRTSLCGFGAPSAPNP